MGEGEKQKTKLKKIKIKNRKLKKKTRKQEEGRPHHVAWATTPTDPIVLFLSQVCSYVHTYVNQVSHLYCNNDSVHIYI